MEKSIFQPTVLSKIIAILNIFLGTGFLAGFLLGPQMIEEGHAVLDLLFLIHFPIVLICCVGGIMTGFELYQGEKGSLKTIILFEIVFIYFAFILGTIVMDSSKLGSIFILPIILLIFYTGLILYKENSKLTSEKPKKLSLRGVGRKR